MNALKCVVICIAMVEICPAQVWTHRGFFESRTYIYPRDAPGDSGRFVTEAALRYEGAYKPLSWLQVNGSVEARTDSHRQVERLWRLDWRDDRVLRPAFSLRRLSVILTRGNFTFEGGRQFVRWGKADLLNPTDRFAPRDFLNPVHSDFLGVTATRLTWERGRDTIDAVWAPLLTPSRGPLLNQRWSGLGEGAQQVAIGDYGLRLPGRGQAGIRWNHLGDGYEFSTCYYDGFNHLPLFDVRLRTLPEFRADVQRYFPRLRLAGADAALPLRWFTLKGEAGYYNDPNSQNDDFLLYVIQAERQWGEWAVVGGYAGEWVTQRRVEFGFAPDRGIARTFLGRVSYNLDANRTASFEGALRQDGAGGYAKFEYSQALGSHWRATAALVLLGGQAEDFFGQYRRNSHFAVTLRYSF